MMHTTDISSDSQFDEERREQPLKVRSDSPESSTSTEPRSSPPVMKPEDRDEDLPVMHAKRSHEQMHDDEEDEVTSSHTMVASSAPYATAADFANNVPPSTAAHNMGPPLLPASGATPTSSMMLPATKTPPSGQAAAKPKIDQPQPTKKPEAREQNAAMTAEKADAVESESDSEVSGEPADAISEFDWQALEMRYHQKMDALNRQEEATMKDFYNLCNYFSQWAEAGGRHEVDRSYKRLKTQETYVQHEEDELETKRQHYIKVVDAFRSALDLLKS